MTRSNGNVYALSLAMVYFTLLRNIYIVGVVAADAKVEVEEAETQEDMWILIYAEKGIN